MPPYRTSSAWEIGKHDSRSPLIRNAMNSQDFFATVAALLIFGRISFASHWILHVISIVLFYHNAFQAPFSWSEEHLGLARLGAARAKLEWTLEISYG